MVRGFTYFPSANVLGRVKSLDKTKISTHRSLDASLFLGGFYFTQLLLPHKYADYNSPSCSLFSRAHSLVN